MGWQPITRDELEALIRSGLEHADDAVVHAWSAMRIEPQKWQCSPWGDVGGGFWAVAIRDGHVIWYNDIEDGFNTSPIEAEGVISEYLCNQGDFSDYLATLPEAVELEPERPADPTGSLPTALSGPGRITKRQTTYWTLESERGGQWRVHFAHKAETHFDSIAYGSIELTRSHPLLTHYSEPWVNLYFRGKPKNADALGAAISIAVSRVSNGWRSSQTYRNSMAPLAGGYGLLMRAPRNVIAAARAELEQASVSYSLVGEVSTARGYAVLLLGQSFIVAESFRFEQREG
jgi:hypothetical protein